MGQEVTIVQTKPAVASGTIQGNAASLVAIGVIAAKVGAVYSLLDQYAPELGAAKIQITLAIAAVSNLYSIYKRVFGKTTTIQGIFKAPE